MSREMSYSSSPIYDDELLLQLFIKICKHFLFRQLFLTLMTFRRVSSYYLSLKKYYRGLP